MWIKYGNRLLLATSIRAARETSKCADIQVCGDSHSLTVQSIPLEGVSKVFNQIAETINQGGIYFEFPDKFYIHQDNCYLSIEEAEADVGKRNWRLLKQKKRVTVSQVW